MRRKLRVGVIFGGRSGEHEVSLMSAQGVMRAMDRERYEIVPIGITKDGRWIATGDPLRALMSGAMGETHAAALLAEPSELGLVRLQARDREWVAVQVSQLDVIIPILHGPYGEDGTLQGLLELAGIPYAGAGVLGSAVGMDKAVFKDVMRAHGLPVVRSLVFLRRAWQAEPDAVLAQIESEIGYDCFVKPANLGSSVGISKPHDRQELVAALDEAARYDRKLIVEEAIDAREIEVSVLGNDDPIASVPGEIVPCNEFYDYAAKYIDGESELLIPAPLSPQVAESIRGLATRAYLAIDCAGMARVDFLLQRDTEEVFINELNTIPGFTPISMYPKLWEATGLPYQQLVDRLIELALERRADRDETELRYQH